jgi:hypothetical protein
VLAERPVRSEVVLDAVLIGSLNDDLVLANPCEHVAADVHSGNGQLALVEVDVDVVVLAPVVLFPPLGPSFSLRTIPAIQLPCR